MNQPDQSRYLTHDHIQPIKEQLKEHSEQFQVLHGWKEGVDRRAASFEKSLSKICETLTSTEKGVTSRQDVLSAQQGELTRKFDSMSGEHKEIKVKIDSVVETLGKMTIDDATERGRKEEREKNETAKRASFGRKAVLIGAVYTILQIIVIVSNLVKHA